MTFSFSGSPLSAAALKKIQAEMDIVEFTLLLINSDNRVLNASLQSLRTDVAAFLIDKEYAWSHFPQDDAPDWALFVQQVGYTSPGGLFVNHTVFAAIACMYDCNLTIIQSMLDDIHAFQLLLGRSLALHLTNPHYDKTVQWRKANVQGVVQPLFLAQRGMEHIMGTDYYHSP